jgi:hypothetical protein
MIGGEELLISQHDLLGEAECAAIRDRVLALREHWTPRSSGTLYTLGAASYLDAPHQRDAYLEAARAGNPLLHASFAGILERLRQFFEELLAEAVFFDHQYALPGFHVFVLHGGDRGRDDPAPRAHFDLQWMHVLPGPAPLGTLSFTVPIETPEGGASMAIWHARYQDAVRRGFSAGEYASQHPWQTLTYTRGRMVVHDGCVLHAIGPAPGPAPKGFRITLQGHGVRSPMGWMLYW